MSPDRRARVPGPAAATLPAEGRNLLGPAPSGQIGNLHAHQQCANAGIDENAVATLYHHQQYARVVAECSMAVATTGCWLGALLGLEDLAAGRAAARVPAEARQPFAVPPGFPLGNHRDLQMCASAENDEKAVVTFHRH